MTDPLYEYSVSQLKEYEGKKLMCITKEGLELDGDEEEKKNREEEIRNIIICAKKLKKFLVLVSNRISVSPCVLVTGQYGWFANFERIVKAQAFRDSSMESYMASKNIVEINPIIKSLKPKIETEE
ncbi:heat shock protein Hsp90 family [Gigaspora rosea]|uniref:Heat shock protein Hsp90 family n=1 Tax=Gigaspora rosea TaxID=44941 RepID=A0A397VB55_9GLOM|nr:heat shock protein Hsp90 family [Gigaspora rosea]